MDYTPFDLSIIHNILLGIIQLSFHEEWIYMYFAAFSANQKAVSKINLNDPPSKIINHED
jgi:ABC-type polysaccharide/polyol phosphate export permease